MRSVIISGCRRRNSFPPHLEEIESRAVPANGLHPPDRRNGAAEASPHPAPHNLLEENPYPASELPLKPLRSHKLQERSVHPRGAAGEDEISPAEMRPGEIQSRSPKIERAVLSRPEHPHPPGEQEIRKDLLLPLDSDDCLLYTSPSPRDS